MKKLFSFAVFAISMMLMPAITSCGGDSKIMMDIAMSNASLPSDIGNNITLEKLDYSDNIVTLTYTLDSATYSDDDIATFSSNVKELFANETDDDADTKDMINLLIEGNADLRVVSRGTNGYSVSFTIKNAELKH